jgi:hypothetical protein
MDQDEVAGRHWLILKQEQTNLSLDALSGTPCQKTIDGDDFHRNSQAHDLAPICTELIYIKAPLKRASHKKRRSQKSSNLIARLASTFMYGIVHRRRCECPPNFKLLKFDSGGE